MYTCNNSNTGGPHDTHDRRTCNLVYTHTRAHFGSTVPGERMKIILYSFQSTGV